MNKIAALVFLITVLGLSFGQPAMAEKYTCTAVKNLAKVGVHKGNEVGVEEDTDADECRFSINGATTDSPPLNLVMDGLNAIRVNQGMLARLLRDKDIMPLAYLLLAPSQVDTPDDGLTGTLKNNLDNLTGCFDAFYTGKIGFSTQGTNLFCRIVASGDGANNFGGIETVITVPQLQLRVSQGNRNLYLFVPVSFRSTNPLRVQ